MAQIMSEVLGSRCASSRFPPRPSRPGSTAAGKSDAMAQATADMMVAKNEGLDNAEPRTPEPTTPTTFRQWCQEILHPAVLA